MTATLDRPPDQADRTERRRSAWSLVVVALLALALGGLVGAWVMARDRNPYAVGPDYAHLTERQERMLAVLDGSSGALKDGRGLAFAAYFTADGVMVTPAGTFLVRDGTLAAAASTPQAVLRTRGPVVFNGTTATFVSLAVERSSTAVVEFTSSGDVQIRRVTVFES